MLLGASVGFVALFSVFVAAMLVLIVLTVRFVVRRDRERRDEWRRRHEAQP